MLGKVGLKYALFMAALLAAGLQGTVVSAQPVEIESGLLEQPATDANGVRAFKGIPYAAAPIGDLRWSDPQSPPSWEGVRKTDSFGATCPHPAPAQQSSVLC